MLNTARTIITCHIDAKITVSSSTLTLNQPNALGINKINTEVVQNFGHMKIGGSHVTTYADASFFNY